MVCKRYIAPGIILYPDMFEFKNYDYSSHYDEDKCTACLTSIGAPRTGWPIERSGLAGALYE